MVALGGGLFLMREVPLYALNPKLTLNHVQFFL